MTLGAIPPLHFSPKVFTVIGLLLIGVGSGGIKPCVSAFGGDQFRIPEQAHQLASFFLFFYFSINAGSLLSTLITPVLRSDVHCFGDDSCFSLAFGVPAVLMIVSTILFVLGRFLYKVKKPSGNMIVLVGQCISVRKLFTTKSSSDSSQFFLECNLHEMEGNEEQSEETLAGLCEANLWGSDR
jgi:solute carrier family 15 oligopeptide transporter 1